MATFVGEKNSTKDRKPEHIIEIKLERKKERLCSVICLQDLAQYVNEVKRDNETLREIDQYQKSIENLVSHLFLPNNYMLISFSQFFRRRVPVRSHPVSLCLFFCRISL